MDILQILKEPRGWIENQLVSIGEFLRQLLPSKDLNIDLRTFLFSTSILMIALGLIIFLHKPLKRIIKQMTEYKKAAYFALKIEKRIRHLNGISAPNNKSSIDLDLVSSLKSSTLFLDRFIEVMEHRNKFHSVNEIENSKIIQQENVYFEEKEDVETFSENFEEKEDVETSSEIIVTSEEPKLSETAKELIKLRDSVLLVNTGDKTPNSEILEVLYQRLGKVLEKEGVDTLDKAGKFNIEQQEVVSTKETDDPELNEVVSETIRPGYLFAGNLFRSQEVIIYSFKESR
ncbi:hypothetical protein [Calothrix sp. CCY 0018]|uniref:hypothetical protein n=1 Tax=Calothrix sp. CCY 0018 TaxID=3103864 RepID=UPI0039C5FB71